ncbi:MAG TPA: branched-chain amino acid ABC transporter permease, partial [Actinobacteria bacterium]|nr:branched-chain amino acid ABC transporter permease [Actinomycetota bacterium]
MTQFLQATVAGLSLASIYALLALGFVIIFKSTQVLSFAQPALMIFGAYFVSYLAVTVGIDFWLALAIGILLTALLGAVIERVTLRPLVGKPLFTLAILTIGL